MTARRIKTGTRNQDRRSSKRGKIETLDRHLGELQSEVDEVEPEALAEEGPFNKIVSINLEKKSLRKVR